MKKGANATEYGFVFGVFELVVFLVSPIYGQYLNRIGPKVSYFENLTPDNNKTYFHVTAGSLQLRDFHYRHISNLVWIARPCSRSYDVHQPRISYQNHRGNGKRSISDVKLCDHRKGVSEFCRHNICDT